MPDDVVDQVKVVLVESLADTVASISVDRQLAAVVDMGRNQLPEDSDYRMHRNSSEAAELHSVHGRTYFDSERLAVRTFGRLQVVDNCLERVGVATMQSAAFRDDKLAVHQMHLLDIQLRTAMAALRQGNWLADRQDLCCEHKTH